MNIETTSTSSNTATLMCHGRFDAHEVERVRQAIDGALTSGATQLAMHLGKVPFIDSSGLAELVRGMKHCRELGGDLRIVAPSDPVRVILELTGLVKAFVVENEP